MDHIIQTEKLTKYFKGFSAVRNLSLNICKGEIYGFLGLNGAGKTTTIRMLLGLIKPTSGSSYIKGRKVSGGTYTIWRDVGNLVEIPYSYPDLSVFENLDIFRKLRQIKDVRCTDEIIERLGLARYRNIRAKNLSHGNAQRLGLARAIIHNPEILILDEPSNGLDPAGIVEIREMLIDLALNKGVTIFISSHILGEVARFATTIGIIHEGRLIIESSTDNFEKLRDKALVIESEDPVKVLSILGENGFSRILLENDLVKVTDERALGDPSCIGELVYRAGIRMNGLRTEEEDLESFFLRMIKMKGGSNE